MKIAAGPKFNPHVTIGVATEAYLNTMLAEPFKAFTFSPAGALVYQLGSFGTARKELGMATSETIMIGDTMETDILGGVQMGYRTVLVLTGSTKREDLPRYAYQPEDIQRDRVFVDVLGMTPGGKRVVDLTRFHDTEPFA